MPILTNPRHEQFAQSVASGVSEEKAYVLAKFSPRGAAASANRLRKTTKVSARIAELQQPIVEAAIRTCGIDKAWVMLALKKNYDRAMQEEPVLDREGNQTGEFVYAGAVANRAVELIGKELGMFIEQRRELPAIEDVTDETLRDWLKEAQKPEMVQ